MGVERGWETARLKEVSRGTDWLAVGLAGAPRMAWTTEAQELLPVWIWLSVTFRMKVSGATQKSLVP